MIGDTTSRQLYYIIYYIISLFHISWLPGHTIYSFHATRTLYLLILFIVDMTTPAICLHFIHLHLSNDFHVFALFITAILFKQQKHNNIKRNIF